MTVVALKKLTTVVSKNTNDRSDPEGLYLAYSVMYARLAEGFCLKSVIEEYSLQMSLRSPRLRQVAYDMCVSCCNL